MGNNRKDEIPAKYPQYPILEEIKNEIHLFLDYSEVPITGVHRYVHDHKGEIKIKGNPPRQIVGDEIEKIGSIKSALEILVCLYDKALKIPGKTNDDITALEFHYCFDSGIKIIYEPILMTKVSDSGGTRNRTRKYDVKGIDEDIAHEVYKYYEFDNLNQKFIGIPSSTYNTLKSAYEQNILIKHFDLDADLDEFNKDIDKTSAVYPFQMIFCLLFENSHVSKNLLIFNSVHKSPGDPETETQHSILLSPNIPMPRDKGITIIYFNKFANLAHLCPPHRDRDYRLESCP